VGSLAGALDHESAQWERLSAAISLVVKNA
jgi:hypothetical protein